MTSPNLTHLTVFASVARHLSFQRAATDTGMSTSAVSHAIRGLEDRLGVTLFNRTTRSVALTEAGRHFLDRLQPALRDVDAAVEAMNMFRASPTGTVRINTPLIAAHMVVAPVMARFLSTYPDLSLEIVDDNLMIDVIAAGFDAGIRYPDAVPVDMVAVPLGPPCRFAVVASQAWLGRHGLIGHPDDLLRHECVRYRLASGKTFQWEFEKDGQERLIDVNGRISVGDELLALRAAMDGVGPAFVFEHAAKAFIEAGHLVRLLDDWCPILPSFVLYYSRQRQASAALRAFIEIARQFG